MRSFIIFGQGRSGSKLLVHLLKSHPQVQCDGEILGKRIGEGQKLPYWLVRRYRFPTSSGKPKGVLMMYGFKLFVHHITEASRTIHAVLARDWQIVHIQRRNLFDQAVSRAVASTTMHWVGFNGSKTPIPPISLFQLE